MRSTTMSRGIKPRLHRDTKLVGKANKKTFKHERGFCGRWGRSKELNVESNKSFFKPCARFSTATTVERA